MSDLDEELAEVEFDFRCQAAFTRADWNLARAAACPWYAWVRRAILVRRARACVGEAQWLMARRAWLR